MQVKLTIGERLKDLRTAQKLSLEQLAAEVGISKSALGKYDQRPRRGTGYGAGANGSLPVSISYMTTPSE